MWRKGVPIPTLRSRKGSSKKRLQQPQYWRRRITVGKRLSRDDPAFRPVNKGGVRGKSRNQRYVAASIQQAKKQGRKYIYLDLGSKGRGIFDINYSTIIKKVWNLNRKVTHTKANPMLARTLKGLDPYMSTYHRMALEDQLRQGRPLWAERLKDARVTTGSRERLDILCQALNDNGDIGSIELRSYLDNFDWESLMGITDMMGDLKVRLHRDTVTDYLTLRGKDRVHIVARGITDKRPQVVAASATILARIGSDQALQQLAKGIAHPDLDVRRAMASALSDCPNDDSLPLMRQLVSDSDGEVRQLAIDAILARRGQPAFDTLTEVINDDQFTRLDPDTQRAEEKAIRATTAISR